MQKRRRFKQTTSIGPYRNSLARTAKARSMPGGADQTKLLKQAEIEAGAVCIPRSDGNVDDAAGTLWLGDEL
jgi:hypothetical protein